MRTELSLPSAGTEWISKSWYVSWSERYRTRRPTGATIELETWETMLCGFSWTGACEPLVATPKS
jgi:hypothetical protein